MAIGMVFEYLLIAALLAPLAWMAWWGASALGDSARRRPVPVLGRPAPTSRAHLAVLQAVDLNLPRRARAITVFRLGDGAELDACSGPDRAGRCPRALGDGTVPCAGSILSLPQPVRGSAEWHIPAGYQACLVGSYATFRQRPGVRQQH